MLKTILKVVYFAFAVVIAVVVYMSSYSSAALDKITSRLNSYMSQNDYDSIARMFGAITNTDEVASVDSEQVDLLIYEGTSEVNLQYKNGEEDATYHAYDKAYYILLFNNEYNKQNVIDKASNKITNSTSIRFYASEDNYYDYLFMVSNSVNPDQYVAEPKSISDVVLGNINLEEFYTNWNFYNIIIDEVTIDAIKTKLGADIVGINLIDGTGKEVISENLDYTFDFTSQFFTDIQPVFDSYDKFLPILDGYSNKKIEKAEYNEALAVFNEETKVVDELLSSEDNNYCLAFSQKELVPDSIIWNAIAIVLLFAVCVMIVYFLLFEFAKIKSLVFRDRGGKYSHTANKIAPKKEAIKAEVKEIKEEDNKDNK